MKLEIVFENGRKETLEGVESFKVIEKQDANEEFHTSLVNKTQGKGKLFKVNPLQIDRRKFYKPRGYYHQEWTRQIIQEAFAEVDKHPEKYLDPFYTMIPTKNRNISRNAIESEAYANELGGQMANWVEQALEWAQRISNGEGWVDICDNPDTAPWHRMVVWKDDRTRRIGGARCIGNINPATYVLDQGNYFNNMYDDTVPLVVFREN